MAIVALAMAGCGARADDVPPGYQGIVEHEERHLAFEVPGRVAAVPVHRGQVFAAGEPLARLDEGLAHPARAARAAELEAARAQVALLRAGSRNEDVRSVAAQVRGAQATQAKIDKNLARARELLSGGASTRSEIDNLEQDALRARAEVAALDERLRLLRAGSRPEELDAAEARVAATQAALELEDQRLARHTLRADAEGAVLDIHLEAGETAGAGVPVLTVADTARPYVDVFVPPEDVARVRLGTAACVHVDGGPACVPGQVEDVGRRTEFTPRFLFSPRERPHLVVRVRVRIEDPERNLHAGLPAFVTWN